MRYMLLLIPACLLGCGWDWSEMDFKEDDDPRLQYKYHTATYWTVTPSGVVRDAGPFGSVAAGYVLDVEINLALDYGRVEFSKKYPEYAGANPQVHLTDDYVFFVPAADSFASGMAFSGAIYLALWTRGESVGEPGDCWIKRAPGEYFGVYYSGWRFTTLKLVPAYVHETLHYCIGDPYHQSPLWSR